MNIDSSKTNKVFQIAIGVREESSKLNSLYSEKVKFPYIEDKFVILSENYLLKKVIILRLVPTSSDIHTKSSYF